MMNIPKIKINFITYIYVFLFLFSGYKNDIFLILIIFLFHEFGHIISSLIFKVKILEINLYPFGGMIKLDKLENFSIIKDLIISSSGVLMQLILFAINKIFIDSYLLNNYNLMILFINIIPVIPLDGSKILFNLYSKFFSYYNSLTIYNVIGFFSAVCIFIYQIVNTSVNYIFLMYIATNTIFEIKNTFRQYYKFLLERYIYKIQYKKHKFYKKNNLKYLKREVTGYFYTNKWVNEQDILAKKFDISTYIW